MVGGDGRKAGTVRDGWIVDGAGAARWLVDVHAANSTNTAAVAPSRRTIRSHDRRRGIVARVGDRFEFRNVRVDGDDGPIVEGFSARIPADGLTAIVGPSGCGKTTLLRLLNRLDDPDAGDVLFDGRAVGDYDVLELRRRVQLVGQVPVPFAGTVADNVGPEWEGLLARVGLPTALGDRPADVLSVGEAQRMCLARALGRHPECLVLDDPTSALDTASKGGVERLIRSLADDGLTIVMVTHDPRQATELADRVIEVRPR